MNIILDKPTTYLMIGIMSLLTISSIIGLVLKKMAKKEKQIQLINNLVVRIKSWWIMCFIFVCSLLTGGVGSLILFGLISFLALREFITLTPTNRGDHRALFWIFFIILPFQYYFVGIKWYGMFSIFIPVYAFIFLPARMVIAGNCERFLERAAKIQWGLMVCVYCISHAPALLTLRITNFAGQNAKLLFFLIFVIQISDVFQYIFGKMLGKTKIAPTVSPNKTVEGFIGGILMAVILGTSLWWITPFSPMQAMGLSLVITIVGFFGDLTMSAIKRDRGVKDYGTIIEGHGGMLDRIDSLCLATPVFFHLVRYYFTV